MRALLPTPDGPVLSETPMPQVGPEDVLVRVRAAALNRADLAMLKGAAHGKVGGAGAPLGLEWAGEVVEIGPEATGWRVGDRVMAAGGSAYAEYVAANSRRIYRVPAALSFEQAAGLPVALQTMHDAIATNGQLQLGQSVLILGASSGVGLMGLQIAKFLGAGLVIGSSTSVDRRARLHEFGADLAIDTRDDTWVNQVRDATGGKGVDLVIDQVSGAMIASTFHATRINGRVINVGRLAGDMGEFDFNLHALRRIDYIGVTFRTRSAREVERIVELASGALMPALEDGKLRLPVDATFALSDSSAAFERMRRNQHFGKIVLVID